MFRPRASAAATCDSARSRPNSGAPSAGVTATEPKPDSIGERSERPFEHVASGRLAGEPDAAQLVEIRQRGEIDVLVVHRERGTAALPVGPAERRHQVREARPPAVEIGARMRHLEAIRHPFERALEIPEPVVVDPGFATEKIPLQLAAALEEMERPGEIAFAVERKRIAGEEDLALARKLDPRLHLVEHLRPARRVDDPGHLGDRAVGLEADPIEDDLSALDLEVRGHVGGHRLEVVEVDRAARKLGATAILGQLACGHLEVRRHNPPARAVIVEDELAARRAHELHRGHHHRRPVARCSRRAVQAWPVVAAVLKTFNHHLPVGHLDRIDQDLAVEQCAPGQRHLDSLGDEPGPCVRRQPLDPQIFDDEAAGGEPHAELADVHRPIEPARALLFSALPERRSEVDGHRRHETCADHNGDHHDDSADTTIGGFEHGVIRPRPAACRRRLTGPRGRRPL